MIKATFLSRGLVLAGLSLLTVQCKGQQDETEQTDYAVVIEAEIDELEEEFLIYYEKGEQYPDGYRKDTLWVTEGKSKPMSNQLTLPPYSSMGGSVFFVIEQGSLSGVTHQCFSH